MAEVIRRETLGERRRRREWWERWREEWEKSREKILEKAEEAKDRWKEASLSPQAQARYVAKVVEAALLGLREKGLADVSPDEWYEALEEGVMSAQITDAKVRKFQQRAAPYIDLVKWAREEFKKIAFPDGITAGRWWMDNVNALLQLARRDPSKLNWVRQELSRRFAEAKRRYGERAPTAEDRLRIIREVLAKIGFQKLVV